MPKYLDYPTQKNTPSRKTRKGERNKVFAANRTAARRLRVERASLIASLNEQKQSENPEA